MKLEEMFLLLLCERLQIGRDIANQSDEITSASNFFGEIDVWKLGNLHRLIKVQGEYSCRCSVCGGNPIDSG